MYVKLSLRNLSFTIANINSLLYIHIIFSLSHYTQLIYLYIKQT